VVKLIRYNLSEKKKPGEESRESEMRGTASLKGDRHMGSTWVVGLKETNHFRFLFEVMEVEATNPASGPPW